MTLLLAFTVALCTSLVLTPLARAAAHRFGFVDRPDGQRKLQTAPVALWGGVAVYCGLCAGLAAAMLVRVPGELIPARLSVLLMLSGGLLSLVGLVDDAHNLRARTKLLLQVFAVSPLVLAGFFPERVTFLGAEMPLGVFGPALMVFWLVACVNSLNLLDGLDGFASVVGITLAAAVAAIGLMSGNSGAAVAALALAGGTLGFLPFNLPPATIYLGDAGSMMIGLTLGALAMQATDATGQSFIAVVPLAIMAVPLWDTSMAVVRRRLRGVSIGEPDREHLHHRLVTRGMTNVQALVFASLLCLTAGGAVLLAIRADWELLALAVAASLVGVLAATRLFGEEELGALRRAVAASVVATAAPLALPTRYQGVKLSRHLQGLDLDATWDLCTRIADSLDCHALDLSFSDDCPLAPRSHRGKHTRTTSWTLDDRQKESTVGVTFGAAHGSQCELRMAYTPSGSSNALHAACLADVLLAFGRHFLELALAEADTRVLRIVADGQEIVPAPSRRAA
jgi:UDP-GlcNAc:undecaprenyl-phosphate GlcNAc-1-phosphate transferase